MRKKYYYIENDKRIYKEINGEVWSNILGFPNYWVNKKGQVMGRTGVILKPSINKKGYLKLPFYTTDKTSSFLVHRLVALAFIPNPNNLPQVNHIDCNKQNNNVENLEWCTDEENRIHKLANNLNVTKQGAEHKLAKLTEEEVTDIFLRRHSAKYYINKYGISKALVYGIWSGRNWGWFTKNIDKENEYEEKISI